MRLLRCELRATYILKGQIKSLNMGQIPTKAHKSSIQGTKVQFAAAGEPVTAACVNASRRIKAESMAGFYFPCRNK